MNSIKVYSIISLLLLISISVFSQQSDCSFKLEEAESAYESGILDSIPSLLRDCTKEGFDDDELARAYKLLILTYLFEDYQDMAEFTMLKFLKKFPEYELKANDQVEFTYLYKSYQTVPVYSIGVMGGMNYSFVRIIDPYSLGSSTDYSGDYSVSGMGYQFGLQFERYINEKINIDLGAFFVNRKFNYQITQLDFTTIDYDESQSVISVPLTGTYDFSYKFLNPYVRIGFGIDYIIGASSGIKRIIDGGTQEDITGPDLDILNDRNTLNYDAIVGGGLKLKTKKGYGLLDLRYHFGLNNIVNSESRYSDGEKTFYYNYADDNFSLDNFYISVGYVFSFYKTKESLKK
ncbi:MAG: PorT family protein [Bacteroidales bacterium]|nr:PorT family protein [Bacteroidales bacterium]